jgi:UDP-N-acetylmuramoyl-L-alanyl-D-glutamate--2,6-diaminopimelate ligase
MPADGTSGKTIPLERLIQSLSGELTTPKNPIEITGIAMDSRKVRPGDLFVACQGGTTDGHKFISDAIARGAAAIVGSKPLTGLAVPYMHVPDSRLALAYLAAAYHGFPARKLTVLGVTGTDGKTTTASLIFSILTTAGLRPGMISTVNAVIGDRTLDTGYHVTTPDALDVQAYLAQMVSEGLTHVILEATSHGLAQHRIAACEFDIGVVTNITAEHLDYHGTYEAYRAAKGMLFMSLAETVRKTSNPPRGAALNLDDSSCTYLARITSVPKISYGLSPNADVSARKIQEHPDGLSFEAYGRDLNGRPFTLPVKTHLLGMYNVSNCLAALATTIGIMGLDASTVEQGMAAMPGVPGRMERIEMGQDFVAMVDFAHTPNALRKALEAARGLTQGRVLAVFGAAGLRDPNKRRSMAEVAIELADLTILTAEDPRTEPLEAILREMAAAAENRGGVEGKSFWRVADRGEALRKAVGLARPGDLVIACGKGHEQSMCFGEIEYPWDDRIAMRAALAEHLDIPEPEMPYLPTQK